MRTVRNQTVMRGLLVGLFVVCVIAASAAYSALTWKPRYLEIRISYPPGQAENLTMKHALLGIINTSRVLQSMATDASSALGTSLEETIALIEKAENSTDSAWRKLREEIVDVYGAIISMIVRANLAWANPSLFRPEWFENPADCEAYVRIAGELGVQQTEYEDLDIRLETNRSIARVTYTSRWVIASGEYVLNKTDILVREGRQWKFRKLDAQPSRDEGDQASGG